MIHASLQGRRLLLTGVTGFLGKVWLAHLLAYVPDVHVTVVVRPRGNQGAVERFERIVDTSPVFRPLRAQHGADLGRWLGARVTVLPGDIERPLLGLGHATVADLRLDALVHCAGLTDFQPDPLRAVAVNTLGARHAADLARRTGARLLHVSTAFVAGEVSGEVPESLILGRSPNGSELDAIAEVQALQEACRTPRKSDRIRIGAERARALGWPNLYTYSKGLAEQIVGQQPGAVIVRPSIVECARTFPFAGWNEGLNTAGPLAWLISTAFRELPTRPANHFDVVPVDDVARGMTLVLAAMLRDALPESQASSGAPPVFHLAASDANPLTFGRTVELTGLGLRRWTRKGHGRATDQLFRHLDPVPAPSGGLLPVNRVRKALSAVRDGLSRIERADRLPTAITDLLSPQTRRLERQAGEVEATLKQVERMLELYKPFIHDNDYTFRTDGVRRLGRALPVEELEFRWVVPTIDWRWYWVDVEYPGLCTWSIPEIRGEAPPMDPPSVPPFRLVQQAPVARRLQEAR